jgi:hypothetical protein
MLEGEVGSTDPPVTSDRNGPDVNSVAGSNDTGPGFVAVEAVGVEAVGVEVVVEVGWGGFEGFARWPARAGVDSPTPPRSATVATPVTTARCLVSDVPWRRSGTGGVSARQRRGDRAKTLVAQRRRCFGAVRVVGCWGMLMSTACLLIGG